jgi:predicted nucleic acid-binding protein
VKRTYIDACVLIAAFQGKKPECWKAFEIIDDPDRSLVVSDYLRIEVLPKPTFHGRTDEVEFMYEIIEASEEEVLSSPQVTQLAIQLAGKYDLSPIDSLHMGSALVAGVDEFVTMEKPTKPMCRVREVRVVSLHPESEKGS